MKFWDSSAILPLIVEERTSDQASRYYDAFPALVVWWGASVECSSALARLERDGAIDTRDLTRALQQLQTLQSEWNEVQPWISYAPPRSDYYACMASALRTLCRWARR